jgi:hypothetical protein
MASRTASEVIDFMELGNYFDEVGIAGIGNKPSGNTQKRILQLAHLARGRWAQLAAQKLHSSQRKYLNALGVAQAEDYGASVTLEHESSDGRFAKMVEWGSAGQDMRKTLLDNVRPGAKGVKTTKDGVRYRIIPFRRMTGDATGRNFPTMGGAYDKSMGQTASNAFRNSIVNRLKAGRPMHQRVVGGAIDPRLQVGAHQSNQVKAAPNCWTSTKPACIPVCIESRVKVKTAVRSTLCLEQSRKIVRVGNRGRLPHAKYRKMCCGISMKSRQK